MKPGQDVAPYRARDTAKPVRGRKSGGVSEGGNIVRIVVARGAQIVSKKLEA